MPSKNLQPSITKKNLQVMANYRRLRNIRRCNNLPSIHAEDVAQHSFYTAILATTLAEEYNLAATKHNLDYHPFDDENYWDYANVAEVTKRALFHDMEEAFTSDIPWNVKHHSPSVSATIKDCVDDILQGVYAETSVTMLSQHQSIKLAKSDLEGKFVAMADMIEGAWYCYEELQSGNTRMAGLFLKYCKLIDRDPFGDTLRETSPMFLSITKMFRGMLESAKKFVYIFDAPILD